MAPASSAHPSRSETFRQAPLGRARWFTIANVLVPWVGALVVATAMLLLGASLRPGLAGIWMFLGGFVLSALGTEVGYHRLFGHRAFDASAAVRAVLVILGSTAAEGPVFRWAAIHRKHHEFSDRSGDPHSPRGEGWLGGLLGLWHAHIGWMRSDDIDMRDYLRVADLVEDPVLYRLGRARMYYLWLALGLVLPAALGAWTWGDWAGALRGLLWGGFLRVIAKQNAGFSINSIGHAFGWKTFETGDESRDNPWLVLPTLGAGWQNTHHAFPSSWCNRILWWQVDPAEWVIRGLAAAGLAWNLEFPSTAQIQAKRLIIRPT